MSLNKTTFIKGERFDWNKEKGKCPACNASDKPKGGVLRKIKGKFGDFLSCNRYPDCKYKTSSYSK